MNTRENSSLLIIEIDKLHARSNPTKQPNMSIAVDSYPTHIWILRLSRVFAGWS